MVTGADTAALDAVTGSWLMERASAAGNLASTGQGITDDAVLIPVRVDGKTVRGARNADGSQVHLLAALAGRPGVVAAQAGAGAKTNEIPMIIPLLDGVDLDRAVVTADALHCQRATADYLHRRGADFILPAKDNQPGLFDALDALPWRDVPVAHAAAGRGHGRIETRTIQVMDAPGDLPFPHVSQAYLIERHVTALGPGVLRAAHPRQPRPGPARQGQPHLRPRYPHPRQASHPVEVPHPGAHLPGHPVDPRRLQALENQDNQKLGKAIRTETTINDTGDFGIGKRLGNLPALRQAGFLANRRLLATQRLGHEPIAAARVLEPVTAPAQAGDTRVAGCASATGAPWPCCRCWPSSACPCGASPTASSATRSPPCSGFRPAP